MFLRNFYNFCFINIFVLIILKATPRAKSKISRVNIVTAQADKVSKSCRVENQQVGVVKRVVLGEYLDGPSKGRKHAGQLKFSSNSFESLPSSNKTSQ